MNFFFFKEVKSLLKIGLLPFFFFFQMTIMLSTLAHVLN